MSRIKKATAGSYSYDDDEDYVPTKKIKYSKNESEFLSKAKKHTLDSDEEDDDTACVDDDDDEDDNKTKESNMLQSEDVDGQEDSTIEYEGETTITPFNMKEEMEEGHFDKDGFYQFKKDNDLKDAWLDDIDWVKVKRVDEAKNKYGSDDESDTEEVEHSDDNDIITVYTNILNYLTPGDTVAKALKRLGGNKKKISSAQKWKMKKLGQTVENSDDAMKKFLELTEFANKIIESGNMDVYQETFEMINLKIERSKAPPSQPSMDMFSEEVSNKNAEDDDKPTGIDEIKWRFRWKNEEGEKIHGPFKSEEMLKWQNSGHFDKGVYVQKMSETSGDWYSSKRIDFEIYV